MTSIPPGSVRVRIAGPGDEQRVAAMAQTLSPGSICRRFLGAIPRDIAIEELRRETRSETDAVAFVAEDTDGTIVGEAYAALIDDDCAEAAFVVADRSQHHGIGKRLFSAVVRELAARGVHAMHIETSARNTDMQHLVDDSSLPYTQQRFDDTVIITLHIGEDARDRAL
jgi:GNAT superfamily N-acetyltransferase